jgi:hypothetical protein
MLCSKVADGRAARRAEQEAALASQRAVQAAAGREQAVLQAELERAMTGCAQPTFPMRAWRPPEHLPHLASSRAPSPFGRCAQLGADAREAREALEKVHGTAFATRAQQNVTVAHSEDTVDFALANVMHCLSLRERVLCERLAHGSYRVRVGEGGRPRRIQVALNPSGMLAVRVGAGAL